MDLGNFFQVPVNYLAVLVCGIFGVLIGYVWYGPLFGKEWSKLAGGKTEGVCCGGKTFYEAMFGLSLVMAYTLAHFVWYAAPGSLTLFIAIKTALWAWIGFVGPTTIMKFLMSPERKPAVLLYIEAGYYLVSLVVMSVVLYSFR